MLLKLYRDNFFQQRASNSHSDKWEKEINESKVFEEKWLNWMEERTRKKGVFLAEIKLQMRNFYIPTKRRFLGTEQIPWNKESPERRKKKKGLSWLKIRLIIAY